MSAMLTTSYGETFVAKKIRIKEWHSKRSNISCLIKGRAILSST
jgi:hypothetical protein